MKPATLHPRNDDFCVVVETEAINVFGSPCTNLPLCVSASEMCVHTNDNFLTESLDAEEEKSEDVVD